VIEFFTRLSNLFWRIVTQLYFRPQFGSIGPNTLIRKPMLLRNVRGIRVGARCGIRDGARLELIPSDGRFPSLAIGDDVSIEQNVHIACNTQIRIGDRVTIAARCTIVDISHPFDDVERTDSIGARLSIDPMPVTIEEGCFLGVGTVILPNVTLGKYCVVGANSVVTKSMPAYSVCAGAPARVIRRYDPTLRTWDRAEA
jgi:acetyltransferase-like isoleucine patch superfamily enzyme